MDVQNMAGNGKVVDTGFGTGVVKDELKEAVNYLRSNLSRVTQAVQFGNKELHIKATDVNGISPLKNVELSIFLSLISSLAERPVQSQLIVLGSMSIGGVIIGSDNLVESLQIAVDSGAKKILIPAIDMVQLSKVPADILSKFSLLIYSDPIDAAFKAMGLN